MKFKQALKGCGLVLGAFLAYLASQIILELILLATYYTFYAAVGVTPSYDDTMAFVMKLAMPLSFYAGLITLTVFAAAPLFLRRSPLEAYKITPVSWSNTALLLLFGISASVVVGLLWEVIPFPESAWEIYNETVASMLETEGSMTYLAVVLMAPLVEELLCRSVFIGQFSKFMPSWLALILSSAIFGVMHGNLIQGTYAFACGLLLGAIYLRFESVTASILFHMGFNASSYLLSAIPEEPAVFAIIIMVLFCVLFLLCAAALWQATAKKKDIPPLSVDGDGENKNNETDINNT